MSSEKRRYPRVAADAAGELELKIEDARGSRQALFPIRIRSFAPEGMGIAYAGERPPRPPAIGARVTVRCRIQNDDIELPGRVAWLPGTEPSEPFDVGLELNLELASFNARRRYATWIVGELSRGGPGGAARR
jgi:hypothetical protein